MRPLSEGIRRGAINSDYREQQRKSAEEKNGGGIEAWTCESIAQALIERFDIVDRNLPVDLLQGMAAQGEVRTCWPIDTGDEVIQPKASFFKGR